MPGFGSKLRIKRLALGLSLRDASKKAQVKQKYILALEEEEILRFKEKEKVIELVNTYAPAIGLDRTELLNDFENLWSDSSTAKIYMQQKYNKQSRLNYFRDQKMAGYGVVLCVVVLLISAGGYFYWTGFSANGDQEGLYAAVIKEPGVSEGEKKPGRPPAGDAGQEKPEKAGCSDQDNNVAVLDETAAMPDLLAAASGDNAGPEDNRENGEAAGDPDEAGDGGSLPRTAGAAFMVWAGALTFITGLILMMVFMIFRSRPDPVAGLPY